MNFLVKQVLKNKYRSRRSPTYFLPPEIWQQIIDEAIQSKLLLWFELGPFPHELSLVAHGLEDLFYGSNRYLMRFREGIATIRQVCRQWNELATFTCKKWSFTILPRDNDIKVSPRAAVLDINYAYDSDLQSHLRKFNPEYVSVLYLRGSVVSGTGYSSSEDFSRFHHLRAIHLSHKLEVFGTRNLLSMLKTVEKEVPRLELLSLFVTGPIQHGVQFDGLSFPLLQTLIIRGHHTTDWPIDDWKLPSISQLSMTSHDTHLMEFPPLSLLYAPQLLSLNLKPWPSNNGIDFWETFPSLISVSGDILTIPSKTSPLHPLQHLNQYKWFYDKALQYCPKFEEHIESSYNNGGFGIRSIILPFQGVFDFDWNWDQELPALFALEQYCLKRGVRIYSNTGERVFSVKDEIHRVLSKRKRPKTILDRMIKLRILN